MSRYNTYSSATDAVVPEAIQQLYLLRDSEGQRTVYFERPRGLVPEDALETALELHDQLGRSDIDMKIGAGLTLSVTRVGDISFALVLKNGDKWRKSFRRWAKRNIAKVYTKLAAEHPSVRHEPAAAASGVQSF